MRSYKEIIKDDKFQFENNYIVDTDLFKMCWGCERKNKLGYMVWDASRLRRIFFCEDCFSKLKK